MPLNPGTGAGAAVARERVVPRLERLLAKVSSHRKVRHAIVGAAAIDGSWEWSAAAGEARPDGTPMGTATPWFLASVTKLYIASVVLRLSEQGRLDLNAPISEYLPDGLRRGLHGRAGVDRTAEITATHLLAHATGLPDSLVEHPKGGRSLVDQIQEADLAFSFAAAIGRVRGLDAHFAPSDLDGERPRVRYSDTNYQLLMLIAEQVSGLAIGALHRRLLFEPLGLRHTWFPGDAPLDPAGPPATPWLGDWPLQERPLALRSIGDLYATTADVLRFGRALFTGEAFADPATAGLMHRRFRRFGFPRSAAAIASPAWPIEYGLGMMRFALSRPMAAGRRLPPLIGHTGSTASWLWYSPPLGLVLAGTADQATKAAFPFRAIPPALRGLDR
ncbi:MAG: beta-lactamase family protein [Actinobacteria bacterium]|nr:beta-lactamase family protein [Actinomycetota bacterium]